MVAEAKANPRQHESHEYNVKNPDGSIYHPKPRPRAKAKAKKATRSRPERQVRVTSVYRNPLFKMIEYMRANGFEMAPPPPPRARKAAPSASNLHRKAHSHKQPSTKYKVRNLDGSVPRPLPGNHIPERLLGPSAKSE